MRCLDAVAIPFIADTRLVLPAPLCPRTTTLRILSVVKTFMSHVLLASFSLTAIVARWMAYYHSFFRIFCFFIACILVGRYFVYSKYFFSIHAPTRGATLWRKNRHGKNNFNPRSHTGSDSNIIQKFRIFSFICDNYKYTLHFYASFCGCIIPHNKNMRHISGANHTGILCVHVIRTLHVTKPGADQPVFLVQRQYVLLWFDIYFLDNRSANYRRFHL